MRPGLPTPRAGPAGRGAALLAVALLAAPVLLLRPAPASGQVVQQELSALSDRLDAARDELLPYLSPENFREAEDALREAREGRSRGDGVREILSRVERAREALDRARRAGERGRRLLSEGLEARARALEAGAPERAPERWREAEERLRGAGREVEEMNPAAARDRAGEAAELYREAGLRALRRSVLGGARSARDSARAREAGRLAPLTYSRADSLLARADRALLPADRDLAAARALADSALRAFRRAGRLAALADSARAEEPATERILRGYEEQLARAAAAADTSPALHRPPEVTVDRIVAAVGRRDEEIARLQGRLAAARDSLRPLPGRIDSLRAALSRARARGDSLASELARRERRERRIREAAALFDEEEGRVRAHGDSLVLELYGMRFPAGESELTPESRSLLVKVESVIRSFPGARVTIVGHTDTRGDEEGNRILSRERAIAVRERLLSRLPIDPGDISSVGRGESRPIATNDTEEGRAMNRRIEVVLELPEETGG